MFLKSRILGFLILLSLPVKQINAQAFPGWEMRMEKVCDIPLPPGYERVKVSPHSFGAYLRYFPLRKDRIIYLYDKRPKSNQLLHYAVLDMPTGEKDLQQCADAIMRLRGEYFFGKNSYDSILFYPGRGKPFLFSIICKPSDPAKRNRFEKFLENVFISCGTYSLEKQLHPVKHLEQMEIGDVFVKGGAPGHAEIVMDMAVHTVTGNKIFLLAQGYMPAQDMHILMNPFQPGFGPWYVITAGETVKTASWIFTSRQLRRW